MSERPWKLEAVAGLIAAWMLGMVVGLLISQAFVHIVPGQFLGGNRFVQFVISTFFLHGFGLILIQIFLVYHRISWSDFLGWQNVRSKTILRVLLTTAIVLPVVLGLNSLSAALLTKVHVAPTEQESMKILEISVSLPQRIVFGIGAILLAPVVEESIFRGILYPTIKGLGFPQGALFGSSLLFAFIHFNLMTFVPLFLLALVLVWLLETTGTLVASILAHASFNAANFVIYLNEAAFRHWWEDVIHSVGI